MNQRQRLLELIITYTLDNQLTNRRNRRILCHH